jgi:hypothetical protein
MRVIILFFLLLSVGCVGSKNEIVTARQLMLTNSDVTRLISQIEVDPSLEQPLHVVVEERGESIMIVKICQSSFSSRTDFKERFQHGGRDIFVYDFARKSNSNKVIFFNQDSPMWRFVFYRHMNETRIFKMQEIESWD